MRLVRILNKLYPELYLLDKNKERVCKTCDTAGIDIWIRRKKFLELL